MAAADSWRSIEEHGLLSTSALLDLFEITGVQREVIECARRRESIAIHHPIHGTARIRDNKPINETVLRRTLVGMTEPEWYRTLNGRVFFWLSTERLNRLRNAPPYRDRKHDILTLDTARLLEALGSIVELAHLNTGAVHPGATYTRGAGTFQSIVTYPWQDRLAVSPSEPIVELTVPYAVAAAERFVVDITTR
ncbi:MAG: hypothetical protein ABSG43_22835 [Solirubrobacteraceae bacterium]|jgi:hypothetical protein